MKKRSRMMSKKKVHIIAFCIILLIAALSTFLIYSKGLWGIRGVYYPAIDEKIISTTVSSVYTSLYGTSYLYYDGDIYTTANGEYNITAKGLNPDNYLKDVYIYHSFLSTDQEMLSGTTSQGELYALDGYDKAFRIAVYDKGYNRVTLFNKLNDVWLKNGRDLFDDRLHLRHPTSITLEPWSKPDSRIELTEEEADLFMEALFYSQFIENTKENQVIIENTDIHLKIRLVLENGDVESIQLYDNGYAEFDSLSNDLIFCLNEEIITELLNRFE